MGLLCASGVASFGCLLWIALVIAAPERMLPGEHTTFNWIVVTCVPVYFGITLTLITAGLGLILLKIARDLRLSLQGQPLLMEL